MAAFRMKRSLEICPLPRVDSPRQTTSSPILSDGRVLTITPRAPGFSLSKSEASSEMSQGLSKGEIIHTFFLIGKE